VRLKTPAKQWQSPSIQHRIRVHSCATRSTLHVRENAIRL